MNIREYEISAEAWAEWCKKEDEMFVTSRQGDLTRGRSINVGSAGGGLTEVSIRANDGKSYWYVMNSSEVVEFIHQLSANIGCLLDLKPRDDFASWRKWKTNSNNMCLTNTQQSPPASLDHDKQPDVLPVSIKKQEVANETVMATKENFNK